MYVIHDVDEWSGTPKSERRKESKRKLLLKKKTFWNWRMAAMGVEREDEGR